MSGVRKLFRLNKVYIWIFEIIQESCYANEKLSSIKKLELVARFSMLSLVIFSDNWKKLVKRIILSWLTTLFVTRFPHTIGCHKSMLQNCHDSLFSILFVFFSWNLEKSAWEKVNEACATTIGSPAVNLCAWARIGNRRATEIAVQAGDRESRVRRGESWSNITTRTTRTL